MPCRPLLLLGLVASVASAQTPADSTAMALDSVVVVERILSQRTDAPRLERSRMDSVVVRTQRETPSRRARFAFPTEGGVFYYRAGPGSAIRRVQRDAPVPSDAAQPQLAERQLEAPVTPARAGEPAAARPADRAAPSGVTQRDLDRLERRLMDALDRRGDRETRSRQIVPVIVPRAGDQRPAETPRPAVTDVPVSPGDSLRRVPVSPLADEPEVTVEEVERAFLDTGLFRTTRIFFAFGEAELLPISQRNLDVISEVLLRYPALRIEVGGHTDAVSSDAFNLELSQRRAGSVASYLIARDIDAERITAVGYGEARPVASNETETGRALNRRVEFVVQGP